MPKAGSLTLLNPHADDFVSVPLSFMLVGRRGLCKYKYLVEEPIRRGQRVSILIDGTLSSLIDQRLFNGLPGWLRGLILRIEVYFWLRFNGLAPHIDVHRSLDTVKDRTALYVFSYKNCVGSFDRRFSTISSFNSALINLSHYFIRTSEKAGNIAKLRNAHLISEGDLSQNPYFRHFFSKAPPISVVPFAVNSRFTVKRSFADREAKCAATGSFHNLNEEVPPAYYREFIDFFKTDTYHPVRKMLYRHREELSEWLTSRISPYREMKGNRKSIGAVLRNRLRLDVVQSDYFSFDVVDFYNQHQLAIVGEELSGAPAVGFFEAMACGCVSLGLRGAYYDGLELEHGVHYLRHDGTIESLKTTIEEAIADPEHTSRISKAGLAYIASHCTQGRVWEKLKGIWDKQSTPTGLASSRS
jgi:glycosyltransferase involved in cell wall biosynthesis